MKLLVYLTLAVVPSNLIFASTQYVVPHPTVQVFSPKGFRVSIPHEEGIHLFAFHGNINVPMEGLDAGQFSRDILKRSGDSWVFEDKRTKLKNGDVIYYWLFVIKNNLGYRFDDGLFTVEDITPRPKEEQHKNHSHASSNQPSTQFHFDDKNRPLENDPRCKIALNLTNTVDYLTSDVRMLKEINNVLKEIISRNSTAARTLTFGGTLPPYDDPHYTAQIIITEKLGLKIPVANATWNADNTSVTFQVSSLDDKIYLIRTARNKLEKIQSKITLTF